MELCFASGPCSIATASPPLVQTATFDWHLAAPPQVPAGALLLHVDASAAPGLIAITNRAVSRGAACGTPLSAHPPPPPLEKQTIIIAACRHEPCTTLGAANSKAKAHAWPGF